VKANLCSDVLAVARMYHRLHRTAGVISYSRVVAHHGTEACRSCLIPCCKRAGRSGHLAKRAVGAHHTLIWRAARGPPDAPATRQVVLGLLAPLALNVACAAAAEAVCEHYKLPDADCAQLWRAASPVTAPRAPGLHCIRVTCSARKHGTQGDCGAMAMVVAARFLLAQQRHLCP